MENGLDGYRKLSRMSGFSLEEIVGNCIALIKVGEHAGKIGILVNSFVEKSDNIYLIAIKEKNRKKVVRINAGNFLEDKPENYVYCSINSSYILEELRLFQ